MSLEFYRNSKDQWGVEFCDYGEGELAVLIVNEDSISIYPSLKAHPSKEQWESVEGWLDGESTWFNLPTDIPEVDSLIVELFGHHPVKSQN